MSTIISLQNGFGGLVKGNLGFSDKTINTVSVQSFGLGTNSPFSSYELWQLFSTKSSY